VAMSTSALQGRAPALQKSMASVLATSEPRRRVEDVGANLGWRTGDLTPMPTQEARNAGMPHGPCARCEDRGRWRHEEKKEESQV
jgi:hypothetical protein